MDVCGIGVTVDGTSADLIGPGWKKFLIAVSDLFWRLSRVALILLQF